MRPSDTLLLKCIFDCFDTNVTCFDPHIARMDYIKSTVLPAFARAYSVASRPEYVRAYVIAALFFLSLNVTLYVIPQIILSIFFSGPQNLKKKYNANWALVTGASSGIGKSLAFRLASQGLNVVLVALPDKVYDDTFEELEAKYPDQRFIKVETNLGEEGYLQEIHKKTRGLPIQIVFCNAGYMLTGFFHKNTLEKHMMNMECNATSAVQITHHFLKEMLKKKLRGCFVYTSSAAALMPSPFSVLYAATKSFLSSFGASLAAEVTSKGIDVCVVHPSPVASRFYDKAHKLDMLDFFKGFSVSPDALPDIIFGAVGRTVHRDIGGTAIMFRLMMKFIDFNFLATLFSRIAHTMADYQRHNK